MLTEEKTTSGRSRTNKKSSGVFSDIVRVGQENVSKLTESYSNAPITEVATDYIQENTSNPRKRISEASVVQMVNAIVQCDGIILEPLLIRPIPKTNTGQSYKIVCGDRRLLAARRLEMPVVPVRVREMDDDTAARFALWENLGREDLSAMDIAESVNGLRKIDGLTWDDIGEKFGFSRQWGWQQQKLAELPQSVRDLVREESLSMSNAFLIATELESDADKEAIAERVVTQKISYRALQILLKKDAAVPPTKMEECKDVFTWSPPATHAKRKFARFNRATQDVVEAFNAGFMTKEYAQSLRDLAEQIINIADSNDTDSGSVKTSLHRVGGDR